MTTIKQPTFVFMPNMEVDVYEDGEIIGSIRKDGSGWRAERFSGHYFPFNSLLKSYRNAIEIFGH
jgi:hypothetical protein